MMLRRLAVAVVVVGGLCVWGFARSSGEQAEAQQTGADPVYPADEVEQTGGGSYEAATHRFRGNQSHHWRQVMITQQ
jgi:hypothetical protein